MIRNRLKKMVQVLRQQGARLDKNLDRIEADINAIPAWADLRALAADELRDLAARFGIDYGQSRGAVLSQLNRLRKDNGEG